MGLSNVWVRIIASVTLIPLVLLSVWLGGFYFLVFVDLVIAVGLWEYYRLCASRGACPNRWIGFVAGIGLSLAAMSGTKDLVPLIIATSVVLTASAEVFRNRESSAIQNTSTTLFGIVYVGWLISHLILIRQLPTDPVSFPEQAAIASVVLALLIPWVCDTAAYFSGRALGRHKLIPSVSAGKTIEGAVGGLIGTPVVLLALQGTWFSFLDTWDCIVLGVAGAALSQTGDLAESLLKRDAGVKDASSIIPGHGGVLDRFDSVLFSAPFVYYYLTLVVL